MNYISKRKVINMEQIMNYVKPELIVVAVALYFFGMALKQAQAVKDKYPSDSRRREHRPVRHLGAGYQ